MRQDNYIEDLTDLDLHRLLTRLFSSCASVALYPVTAPISLLVERLAPSPYDNPVAERLLAAYADTDIPEQSAA